MIKNYTTAFHRVLTIPRTVDKLLITLTTSLVYHCQGRNIYIEMLD